LAIEGIVARVATNRNFWQCGKASSLVFSTKASENFQHLAVLITDKWCSLALRFSHEGHIRWSKPEKNNVYTLQRVTKQNKNLLSS
jgi:hypothetical protein